MGLFLVLSLSVASALSFMKLDAKGANGECLPPFTAEDGDKILARNFIRVVNAPDPEASAAIVRLVGTIEKLSQGQISFAWRGQDGRQPPSEMQIIFEMNNWQASEYNSDQPVVRIRPNRQNMMMLTRKNNGGVVNFAMLAHEIAHYLTMKDGLLVQKQYEREVPTPCSVTRYSEKLRCSTGFFPRCYRSEESAEVFSAYLTNPDRLGASCVDARGFMAKWFGEPLGNSRDCVSRSKSLEQQPN